MHGSMSKNMTKYFFCNNLQITKEKEEKNRVKKEEKEEEKKVAIV